MKSQNSLPDLETYARKQIAAEIYPNDIHISKLAKCANCGLVPMKQPSNITLTRRKGISKASSGDIARNAASKTGYSALRANSANLSGKKNQCVSVEAITSTFVSAKGSNEMKG